MRVRLKPWVFLTLLAVATAIILFGVHRYRYRFVRSDAEMLALLPQGQDPTIFFVDVKALRRAGMLGLIAGSRRAEEPEYREFVRQTRFDYSKNIDAVAGATNRDGTFIVVRGRFDWTELRGYAIAHGGTCKESFCAVPAKKFGRWISFFPIQPDVTALALSSNPDGAKTLRPSAHGVVPQPNSSEPVWVEISQAVLKNPLALPAPLRIFAISIQSADAVRLSLSPAVEGSGAVFNLRLDAQCPSAATAETIRNQLQIETKMLKLELAREHRQASSSDLTGLMTSGTFQAAEKRVIGTWPVRKELLNAIE